MDNLMNIRKIKEGFLGQQMIVLPPDTKKVVTKNQLTRRFVPYRYRILSKSDLS